MGWLLVHVAVGIFVIDKVAPIVENTVVSTEWTVILTMVWSADSTGWALIVGAVKCPVSVTIAYMTASTDGSVRSRR